MFQQNSIHIFKNHVVINKARYTLFVPLNSTNLEIVFDIHFRVCLEGTNVVWAGNTLFYESEKNNDN